MKLINEIQIGADARVNGLIMYRMINFNKNTFEPKFKINNVFDAQMNFLDPNNQTLADDNNIVVNYLEYYRDSNGNFVSLIPIQEKTYVIANQNQGGITANVWFMLLGYPNQSMPNGPDVILQIEQTLAGLPLEVPNGYILQTA